MPRVRIGSAKRQRHKKTLKKARGMIGTANRRYRVAIEQVMRAERYAQRGRKEKKRDFRGLWITRINAACRMRGLRYGQLIHELTVKGIALNRKILADLAISDPAAFESVLAAAGLQVQATV
jgi:large subunit ribosomal protein L20